MERNQEKRKRKRRQRLNALLPHQDVLEMCSLTREERVALSAHRRPDCVCAPASYKIMEELIEDPVNEEKERRRKALEKWTEETHKQFVQRLVQHGKDFRKIAESLPNKTVADCVEHYYMTKHCPNFKALKAKAQAETQVGVLGHTEPEETSLQEDQASSTSKPAQRQPWSDEGLLLEAEDDGYFKFRD